MKFRFLSLLLLVSSVVLGGCATPVPMAFKDDSGAELETGNPIFLMTVTQRNTYKTSYQPKLLVVNIEEEGATDKAGRLNFKVDEKGKSESEDPEVGNSYLVRMELKPGKYVLRGLSSMNQGFLILGTFFAPIHEDLEAKEPGVYYLGHVNAVVRERVGEEFKAGASIPLIDQSVVGASGGSFDITISDKWAEDEEKFLSEFPVLRNVSISKMILPEFDRQRAQKWWEEN